MITPESSAADIRAEVARDMPHVLHALKKSYGGKARYESDLRSMAEQVLRLPEGEMLLGNIEQYHSGFTGNHWIVYAYVQNAGFGTARMGHREFIWCDTPDGSISAIQFADPSRQAAWSALVFTGHFFRRYAERERLGDVDLQLVCDFIRHNGNGVFQADPDPQSPGKYRFDVILQHGIGRGYTNDFNPDDVTRPFVSYILTYLPNAMLNPSQRKATAESRAVQASKSRLADTFVSMLLGGEAEEMADRFDDIFISRGMSGIGRPFLSMMSNIIMHRIRMLGTPESEYRTVMLELFNRNKQAVFDYVTTHPSEHYSYLDQMIAAKLADPDIDVASMMTVMLDAKPDDEGLQKFIAEESAKLESRFQKLRERGKIPASGWA